MAAPTTLAERYDAGPAQSVERLPSDIRSIVRTAYMRGALATLWIQLHKPEKGPDAPVIDGSVEAFRRDHPDATDLFAAGDPDKDGEDGDGQIESIAPTRAAALRPLLAAAPQP